MNIDRQLQKIVETPGRELAGLAALVIEASEIVYEGYFGRRYISPRNTAEDLPVTAATKFRVASISKLVATLGLLRLVESGRIDLDADVSNYLPFALRHPQFPTTAITLRQLLSHTSSLRDATAYTIPLPYHLEAFFKDGHPFFEAGAHWGAQEPGRFFCYCNLNFGVMATAIENVTGQRFDLYMQEALFRPLGISADYNVAGLPDDEIPNVATLYRKRRGDRWDPAGPWVAQVDDYHGVRPQPVAHLENPANQAAYEAKFDRPEAPQAIASYQIGTNGTLFSPQGGLRISGRGLGRVMQLLMRGGEGLLRPETIGRMFAEQWRYDAGAFNGDSYHGLMRSWGLSVHRFTHTGTAGDGDKLLVNRPLYWAGHLGDAYGLLSGFLLDLSAQRGVIYILSGMTVDPVDYPGRYSSLSRWEEEILTALGRLY